MNANSLAFYQSLANFWMFSLPTSRGTADYRGAFKTYLSTSEATSALIEGLMKGRMDLSQLLITNSHNEARIKAVDDYLPLVYQLYESILAHGGGLHADKELIFEWKLYLGGNNAPSFRSNDIIFEIIMLLHLKVIFFQVSNE
jgi:hypothetical protein